MEFIGKYQHERSENLDGYFKAVGAPYLVRVMICKSNPDVHIEKEDDSWTITVKSLLKATIKKFKLGEEYTEVMPGATLKSITTLEDGKMVTISTDESGGHRSRSTYELTDSHLVQTLVHESTGQEAKRYFKKVQ